MYKITVKSVLDYVIISDDLMRYIKNMQIDTNKQFTPWRTIKSAERFSDHNAITLKLEYNKIPLQSKNRRETVPANTKAFSFYEYSSLGS